MWLLEPYVESVTNQWRIIDESARAFSARGGPLFCCPSPLNIKKWPSPPSQQEDKTKDAPPSPNRQGPPPPLVATPLWTIRLHARQVCYFHFKSALIHPGTGGCISPSPYSNWPYLLLTVRDILCNWYVQSVDVAYWTDQRNYTVFKIYRKRSDLPVCLL